MNEQLATGNWQLAFAWHTQCGRKDLQRIDADVRGCTRIKAEAKPPPLTQIHTPARIMIRRVLG
jgi:hypothetical protein